MIIWAIVIGALVLWLSTLFKRLCRLHPKVGGRWPTFFWNLYSLKQYRAKNLRGRQDLHNVMITDDVRQIGMATMPEEVEYANPKKDKGEELFIFGSNTGERTTVQVRFARRPMPSSTVGEPLQDEVQVNFRLDDGKGNIYWLAEKEVRQFSPTEYRAAGFAFEPFEGNRTGRIKFRGYLKRNDDDKLYYVQIRFLCLFYTKTYDHQRLFDPAFLAKELSGDSIGSVEDLLENKIEQFCQIKGTFKVEQDEEEELFFLATVGRRFAPMSGVLPRKIIKISGFSTEGHGFQFGLINSGKFAYRYGFMIKNANNAKLLKNISLSKSDFELLTHNKPLSFEAKFRDDPTTYRFEVKKYADSRRLVKVDGYDGMAFVETYECSETEKLVHRQEQQLRAEEAANTLVVSFEQDSARLVELTGGKGASLAQLKHLSKSADWSVPNGLVVTTSAFSLQTGTMRQFITKLKELEQSVKSRKEVEKECQKMVEWFSEQKLDERIVKDIERVIAQQFGTEWQQKLFAVRSSASMEDSSEMSAAGQMTTYLGVKGLANVCTAVVKCWASQFAFVPIEYKRGYGQELNSPMAVVIQEMVDCDSAGVIFTANPTDGDERLLTLTSNFGLGESVVSASADPDTFQLAVKLTANSYQINRSIESIVSKTLGKKALVTRLNPNGTAESTDVESGIHNEQTEDGTQKQSISDDDAIRLGNIALAIQQHYGNPRDIEWGVKDDQLYIFQSRPITNLDSTFTDYELMHEIDSAHTCELELYSRAHWGENFPGSSSWLANFFFLNGAQFFRAAVRTGEATLDEFNPYSPSWGYMYNQLMFNLKNGPFKKMFKTYPKSDIGTALVFGFFGRHITDPDVLEAFKNVSPGDEKPMSWKAKLGMPIFMAQMLFLVKYKIAEMKRKVWEEGYGEVESVLRTVPLSDKLNELVKQFCRANIDAHRHASFGSSLKSFLVWKLLNSSADKSHVDHDRNLLMSHCNDVVSAEVPNMLREVARQIVDKKTFVELSDEEALELLSSKHSTKETQAAAVFAEFIRKHGHRGYREMDPLHHPWRENAIPCVQVIKSLLIGGSSLEPRHESSIEEVMAGMQTPLSWFKRTALQYWFLPWCRDAVGHRENTKSLMVKMGDNIRKAMRQIANTMVEEGILPEADLFYFLKISEIDRLARGERNPLLVMKARQRKRLYPTMNACKFDEFVKGFRMRPRPPKKEIIHVSADAVCMKGTPVTVGTVKARVCVAETIEEAVNIKQGDILLTYSTDIGWSPYFPLLSGICTEIGGTVSHGAVIAREYGIPCLIAVEDVCGHFRTGDIAYIDTKTATIVKVQE